MFLRLFMGAPKQAKDDKAKSALSFLCGDYKKAFYISQKNRKIESNVFYLISKNNFTNLLQSGAVGAVYPFYLFGRPQRVSASFSRPYLHLGVSFYGITVFAEAM